MKDDSSKLRPPGFNYYDSPADSLRREFAKLNFKEIKKKKRHELILWRSQYPEDSPQYQFATHELDSRKISLTLKVTIGLAIFNAIVAILLALVMFQLQQTSKKLSTVQTEEKTTMSQSPVHNNTNTTSPYRPDEENEKKIESLSPKKKTK